MAMHAHAQTGRLFRFLLKKEWLKLTIWLIGSLFFVFIGVFAFTEVYGDAAERQAMAIAMSNPAMEALFGRAIGLDNYTVGAMYSHTMTVMALSLFALLSILLVVRNTRAEEEDGILEMLRALPTGRLSHTISALLYLVLTNVLITVLSTALIFSIGDPSMTFEGALLTGMIYGTAGLFFGAVALLMAQLSSNGRGAMMLSFGILGVSYMLRIIGDSGTEVLSWISPLGLLYGTEPFVNNYWWPVLVALGITALIVILALYLQHRRDIGAGLLPEKAGKRHASALLKTTIGFALRLLKTPLIVWLIALLMLGVSYGSVINDVEGMLANNEIIEQIIMSNPDLNIVDQFISMIIGVLSIAATIPALQALLRLKGEEKKNRTEKIITGNRSRIKILGVFLGISLVTSIVMQLAQLVAFGGAMLAMDADLSFGSLFESGIAYLPAMWVMIGGAVVLIGWLPKFTGLIWAYLGFAFTVLYFADLFDMPEWLTGISPYYHIPEIPTDEWSWTVTLLSTGLAIVLAIVGLIGYQRRDING
ncbi:ABC transporter permease [Amphibacillus sediminis]|uniref:ABC transporter permease n=1 Tax=Amphibacillus sediminis TaxID=360185 RepID=UPI00082B5E00|nr:ABC transporter permease [Amphibacillus sediminis]